MRAVVLGGGYAGVVVTKRLERELPADVELLLVDDDGTHLVQHELHRVIRRPDFGDVIEVPLREIVDRATLVTDAVVDVDTDAHVVELANGDPIEYDAAAICLGAEPAFHDIPGVADHAISLKRRTDAERIHDAVVDLAGTDDGSIVVGGAGLAGVQAAGEIAALLEEVGGGPDVALLEQAPTVAPRFGDRFRTAIRQRLEESGVHVRTGAEVVSATANGVELADGTELTADVLVWTGGIRGSAALGGSRPTVRADLALDDRTFVVGDAGRVVDVDGELATPAAQTAVDQAWTAARNVTRAVTDDPASMRSHLDRYDYRPAGWVVSVGDAVVATVGGQVLTGPPAKALKSTVGLSYLATSGAVGEAVAVVRREFGFVGPE